MEQLEKVRYQSSLRKRFEVAPDPFSRARISFLREMANSIRGELPGAVGLSLWGSLSKGKVLTEVSAPQTDIDLSVFLVIDQIPEVQDRWLSHNPDQAALFAKMIQEEGAADPLIPAGSVSFPSPEPLIVRWLLRQCFFRARAAEERTKFSPKKPDWLFLNTISLLPEHDRSIWKFWDSLGGLQGNELYRDIMRASLFSLDVGGGMRPIRIAFLREVHRRGKGESVWEEVKAAVRATAYTDRPDRFISDFPQSWAEALSYYGVPS